MININTEFICQPYGPATVGLPIVLVKRPDGTYVGTYRHRLKANGRSLLPSLSK